MLKQVFKWIISVFCAYLGIIVALFNAWYLILNFCYHMLLVVFICYALIQIFYISLFMFLSSPFLKISKINFFPSPVISFIIGYLCYSFTMILDMYLDSIFPGNPEPGTIAFVLGGIFIYLIVPLLAFIPIGLIEYLILSKRKSKKNKKTQDVESIEK